ncbi:hypothetical protein [Paenibacillus marinisediminis]
MKSVMVKLIILALICSMFTVFIFSDLFVSAKNSNSNISRQLRQSNLP